MKLDTKAAVMHVLISKDWSKYRLAQEMGVRPIMIDNYLKKGTRMSEATATRFEDNFGIEIIDVYTNRKPINDDTRSSSD